MRFETIRLRPGEDLKRSLIAFVDRNKIQAAFIATCVGSLTHSALRFPYQHGAAVNRSEGEFEIVSLTGTLGPGREDGCHIHVCLTGPSGAAFGGHVQEGCLVCTTAEIVIGVLDGVRYAREIDPATTFPELVVVPAAQAGHDG